MNADKIVVAIVAPGGYAPDDVGLARAISVLEARSCIVRNHYDAAKKYQRFGGTDGARLAQIEAAVSDPEVDIVMALRGGYGMTRLLPLLDYKQLADSKKLFVGHSDFTAFHLALLAQTGAASFAGPMICSDFTDEPISQFTQQHFWQCLENSPCSITGQASQTDESNPVVAAEGVLWGGNLTMLTHLLGTPYFPAIDKGILFLEDVNEHPYRIERMLLQLQHAGVLARQQAILLGDFSRYRLNEYDNGYDFTAMLAYLRAQLSVPILTGLPFGHIRDKVTLAVGSTAKLRSDAHGFQLSMHAYPTLPPPATAP